MENLFRNENLQHYLYNLEERIVGLINAESDEYLANINIDDYLEYIYQNNKIDHIALNEDKITCESKQGYIQRYDHFRNRNISVEGIITEVIIPFTGPNFLLSYRASTYTYNPPCGTALNNNLILTINISLDQCENINIAEIIKDRLDDIKHHLEFSHKDVDNFNESIKVFAKQAINKKVSKFNKFSSFLKTIPFEIKRDENAPKTYEVPTIRKKVKISKPSVAQAVPDPTLSDSEYNNILEICSSMALVMERSPKTYAKMDEEAIRTQFLVQLNGQYQGQATGETFNGNGKTDILIRNDNKNIFIGECKFWKGEKAFLETIDQLLSYVTYRDTKTAILLFVKKNDFTSIVQKLKDIVPKHANFVSQDLKYTPKLNTAFRYIFKNKTDNDKELFITIMAFHVPCEET